MSVQDQMLDRYQALMQVNAEAHLLRTAREVGLFSLLLEGQATLEQIVERLGLERHLTELLLSALVAMKVIEQYREDYALAGVTRLLCRYDMDLGDGRWGQFVEQLRGAPRGGLDSFLDAAAATQWIHTGAAKQAAEILDIGGQRRGLRMLDVGCGSAVWSAAIAYADPSCTVTVVDTAERLVAAKHTIDSIELTERFRLLEADSRWEEMAAAEGFELVLVAGQLSSWPEDEDKNHFKKWNASLIEGGELVLVDLFRGPTGPNLTESIEAIRVASGTPAGAIRDAEKVRNLLMECGFSNCQFVFLAASRQGYGMLVAQKTRSSMR